MRADAFLIIVFIVLLAAIVSFSVYYSIDKVPDIPIDSGQQVSQSISTEDKATDETMTSNPHELVFDHLSDMYIEKTVYDTLAEIRSVLQICDSDCGNMPQPIIALANGTAPAVINMYFHGTPVRRFRLPAFQIDFCVIENPGDVIIINQWLEVNGTNSVKYLIPPEYEYPSREYDRCRILIANQSSEMRYELIKHPGKHGTVYFISINFSERYNNFKEIVSRFDAIAEQQSNIAGKKTSPYYVIAMPAIFANLLGDEGTFYRGDNLITINYGCREDLVNRKDILQGTFAHEYAHILHENLWINYSHSSFFMEGMADAIAIYSGFRNWENVGLFDQDILPGCSYLPNPEVPHTLGRCIFKHLDQEGYLTKEFIYNLLHPDRIYNLTSCDIYLQDTQCLNELKVLFEYSSGQNMTSFIQTEITP